MTIAEKYRKILEKPMPEPFKGYIEELLAHIEGGPKKATKPVFSSKFMDKQDAGEAVPETT